MQGTNKLAVRVLGPRSGTALLLFFLLAVALASVATLVKMSVASSDPLPAVSLVSRSEFVEDASSSLERYFDGFGPGDRVARRCRGPSDCLERYLSTFLNDGLSDATLRDVFYRLDRLAARADAACLRAAAEDDDSLGPAARSVLSALPSVPWMVAILKTVRDAEGGLPHTHGRIVCLPSRDVLRDGGQADARLLETMIHEKIHVFQRLRPEATDTYVREDGYVRLPLARAEYVDGSLDVRSNPDVDDAAYERPGVSCSTVNVFDGPTLRDVRSRCLLTGDGAASPATDEYEHPYERMAYELAARGRRADASRG